jgi:hypothetical protein
VPLSGDENSRSFAPLRMTIQFVRPFSFSCTVVRSSRMTSAPRMTNSLRLSLVIFMHSDAAQPHDIFAQDDRCLAQIRTNIGNSYEGIGTA